MATISELIRKEENDTISFGDYSLGEKKKLEGFSFDGASYKVKTFKEITRLEKNDGFLYESTPGSAVTEFRESGDAVSFFVEAEEDCEITLGLEEETTYVVTVGGKEIGALKSSLSGKLTFSVELDPEKPVKVEIKKG